MNFQTPSNVPSSSNVQSSSNAPSSSNAASFSGAQGAPHSQSSSLDILPIPRFSLVVLMGASGSGKSHFARTWFPPASLVSAEQCRFMVAGDESAEWASAEAFALLETWVTARLKLGQLTVVDATGLEPRFRLRMLDLAREFHAPALLLAFDVVQATCVNQDRSRARVVGAETIERQTQRLTRALGKVREEGWNRVVRLRESDLNRIRVEVRPLRVDCVVPPPYDLIGDVHGCYIELTELLLKLGYCPDAEAGFRHPQGRRVVFVGDLIDRGPASLKVLQLAMQMHQAGTALMTPGNHDDKLLRYLGGGRVRLDHGFERTVAELEALEPEQRTHYLARLIPWLKALPPYLLLDEGKLVVAHAGLPEHLQGRLSRAVMAWALFGEARSYRQTPGQPERVEWPVTYQGRALVIYGHTPSGEARRRGNTLCIDQGCVFGGKLTAYRYPEGELVQIRAKDTYYPADAPDLDGLAHVEPEVPVVVTSAVATGELTEVSVETATDAEAETSERAGQEPLAERDAALSSRERPALGFLGTLGNIDMLVMEATLPVVTPDRSAQTSAEPARITPPEGRINSTHAGSGESSKPVHLEAEETGRGGRTPERSTEKPLESAPARAPDRHPEKPVERIPEGTSTSLPRSAEGAAGAGATSGPSVHERSQSRAARGTQPDLPRPLTGQGLKTRWTDAWTPRSQDVSAALEQLSDSSVDPRWLIYIPPSIAICSPSQRAGLLEHPSDVLQFYRSAGLPVVMEEMHFGVRAVFIIGRTDAACDARFGVAAPGMIYDGQGKAFFEPRLQEPAILLARETLERAGAFERLGAELLIFEALVQPWSLKRQEYMARQALPAATALLGSRGRALEALELAMQRRIPVKALRDAAARDREAALQAQKALQSCTWPVKGIEQVKIVPIQLLASDRTTYVQQDRRWQVTELERWCQESPQFVKCRRVFVSGHDQERAALELWDTLQQGRGAGMVARTLDAMPRQGGRLEVPVMKIRSRDFLRVVYGPQYLNPDMLQWLRERPVRQLRAVSARECALAAEGLELFVQGSGFAAYHPYALAVIASQQEVTDSRR